MRILVDADACPVIFIVEQTAKKYEIPVILLCDTNHVLQSDYSEVKVIGAGADAVDFALVGLCRKGNLWSDNHDFRERSLLESEQKWNKDENIDRMLMEQHIKIGRLTFKI